MSTVTRSDAQCIEIRASAGTGKTYRLSGHFLCLLLRDAPPDQILATTFTRKAAGEILERVLRRLALGARNQEGADALSAQLEVEPVPAGRYTELLEVLTRELHRLRISTLDSFFVQMATSLTLELGLPPGWRIADETEIPALKLEAIDLVLAGQQHNDAVRMMHLLGKGEPKRSVDSLIRDTANTLYEMYRDATDNAWHQFPKLNRLTDDEVAVLLENAEDVPLPEHKSAAGSHTTCVNHARNGDWQKVAEHTLVGNALSGKCQYQRKPYPPEMVEFYTQLGEHAQADVTASVANQTAATYDLLKRFDQQYRQIKQRERVLEFGDIVRALADARNLSHHRVLGYRLDSRISHLLLDEFQDTSLVQWLALRPMVRRVAKPDDQRSFFCVGDVKQAIYGWRGGNSRIFDVVGTEIDHLESEPLTRSYRSSPAVIESVNKVFGNLTKHAKLENDAAIVAWEHRFNTHSTAREDLPGAMVVQVADVDPHKLPLPKHGEITDEHWATAVDRLLGFAADQIADMSRQMPGRSIGVLVRTNPTAGRLVYELTKRGIDASEEGASALSDSAAVLAFLSLVRIADHPGDSAARYHVATSPLGRAIGYTDWRGQASAVALSHSLRERFLLRGYGEYLSRLVEQVHGDCSYRDQLRLEQLVELAYRFDTRKSLRPQDFIDFVERSRVGDASTDRVRVMTVHQAKGLEFDVVVLPELDRKLITRTPVCAWDAPSPADPPDHVCIWRNKKIQPILPENIRRLFPATTGRIHDEAACLLYVALTRAVHATYVISLPSRDNEKSIPQTLMGIVRAALNLDGRLERGERHLITGDENWFRQTEDTSDDTVEPQSESDASDTLIRLAPMPNGRLRGRRTMAPSNKSKPKRVALTTRSKRNSDRAMAIGRMVHRWFEQIEWIEDGLPSDDEFRDCLEDPAVSDLDIDKHLEEFHRVLESPEIQHVLSRSFYRESFDDDLAEFGVPGTELRVERERQMTMPLDGRIINGTIDRMVLAVRSGIVHGADIIDFKTDVATPDELPAKCLEYEPQLNAYQRIVQQMFGLALSQVPTARLVFTTSRRVLRVLEKNA